MPSTLKTYGRFADFSDTRFASDSSIFGYFMLKLKGSHGEFKLCHNTTVRLEAYKTVVIRYHHTDIIEMRVDDDGFLQVTLNTNGWHTNTTKARINQFTKFHISQRDFVWYISHNQVEEQEFYYRDRFLIDPMFYAG